MHKRLIIILTVVTAAFAAAMPLYGQTPVSPEYVRSLENGTRIAEDISLEGHVISLPGSENMDFGIQEYFDHVNMDDIRRTAYIQSLDGIYGFRLIFTRSAEARKLVRYSKVKISLKGSSLECTDAGAYTLRAIPEDAVLEVIEGSREQTVIKRKKINELGKDDIYTLVSLQDCEFAFKDGAYSNIYETYAQRSDMNKMYNPNSSMDGWATLMLDEAADPVYVLIGSNVPWRRTGAGVPQGKGSLEGIVCKDYMPRYGRTDAFQIRPMSEEDIKFTPEKESSYETLVEWNWNENNPQLKTENGRKSTVITDRILPDVGAGFLYSDVRGFLSTGRDMNNPVLENPKGKAVLGMKGIVDKGALKIKANNQAWWNWKEDRGSAIVAEFSTASVTGRSFICAFSFAAGDISAATSYDFPVYWAVEWSVDGQNWERANEMDITLRSLPWWWDNNIDGHKYPLSLEAGLGYTEHVIELPSHLLGRDKVMVRICPSRKNAATLGPTDTDKGAITRNNTTQTVVGFGAISFRYR